MFSTTTKEAASITGDLAANDLKNGAQNVKRNARNTADSAVDEMANYANHAGRKVRNMLGSANDQISETTGRMKDEIQTNPIRSTAIALGVGFIFGVLFHR